MTQNDPTLPALDTDLTRGKPFLDKEYHRDLLKNLDVYLTQACIPESYIFRPLNDFCEEDLITYVMDIRNLAYKNIAGIALVGDKHYFDKLCAITAACLRNLIDARVITTGTLIDKKKDNDLPDPTVLLIPNLHSEGELVHDWKVQTLTDILLTRQSKGKPTLVYVEDLDSFKSVFPMLHQIVTSNYITIQY